MPSPHTINFPDDPDPLARYRREYEQQEEELARKRAREERVQQRAESQKVAALDDYWGQVDARIEQKLNVILKAMDQELGELFDKQHESLQSALDRRDAAIKALRDEVEIKIGLGRKLGKLKAEIDQARQQAPSFKAELDTLREQIAKQQKTISRLRGEHSTLEYEQRQMGAELSRMKRETAPAAAVVEFETSSSRITVGNLHPDAANALREFASQVVDAEDGGAILFSGPAGTA
jgi:chromosome segregation ATPase